MADASSRTEHPFQGMALEDADRSLKTEDSQDSTEQSDAGRGWGPHPVNIRVTIPFPFGRWFFTLVGGPERRDRTRRAIERRKHPLFTLGNLFFLFVAGAVIGTAATAEINARMTQLCLDMKAQGITIYTVLFRVNYADTENLYRNCATSDEHFFNANDNTELVSHFNTIATEIASLRLAE